MGDRFFCHPIHRIEECWRRENWQWEKVYTIGNLDRSRVNGYVFRDGIYGKFDYAVH